MRCSKIYKNRIVNKDKKLNAKDTYALVYIENDKGEWKPALFTETELRLGIARANKNPEDIVECRTGWFQRFLEWLFF